MAVFLFFFPFFCLLERFLEDLIVYILIQHNVLSTSSYFVFNLNITFKYTCHFSCRPQSYILKQNCILCLEYMQTVAKMQYGLTKKVVNESAVKFVVANKEKYP